MLLCAYAACDSTLLCVVPWVPGYPTQPQDVHASSGDKTATVSCTSNDHGIPVDLAQLRAFWPCNNPTNVTLYNRAVAGQVGDSQCTFTESVPHVCVCVCVGGWVWVGVGGHCVLHQTSPYSFEISGLNNGRPYMFDIRIHNAAGWSEVSGMSNCVTPACMSAVALAVGLGRSSSHMHAHTRRLLHDHCSCIMWRWPCVVDHRLPVLPVCRTISTS